MVHEHLHHSLSFKHNTLQNDFEKSCLLTFHRRFMLWFLKMHVISAYEFTSSNYFSIYYSNCYNTTIGEDETPSPFLKILWIFRYRIVEWLNDLDLMLVILVSLHFRGGHLGPGFTPGLRMTDTDHQQRAAEEIGAFMAPLTNASSCNPKMASPPHLLEPWESEKDQWSLTEQQGQ